MSFEITGKLVARFDTVQRSESFKTREFVVEVSEDSNGKTFTNYIKFQCVQDRTLMLDRFTIGEEVRVQFNIKGSKWERDGKVNYITNLDAWKIESKKLGSGAPSDAYEYNDTGEVDSDDLPF